VNRDHLHVETVIEMLGILGEAAKLEHGVMCSYLYAAFALRTEPDDGLPDHQREVVRRWHDEILDIAIEEMGHLALVANLSTAMGVRPNLAAPGFPLEAGALPAGIRVALRGFDLDVLEHFVFLERPEDSRDADGTTFEGGPDYSRGVAAGRFFPRARDYTTLGELYAAVEHGMHHLHARVGERFLFSTDPDLQLGPDVVDLPGLLVVRDLDDALQALLTIVRQGEGAPGATEHSHFTRFVAMRDEYRALLDDDPTFVASMPVATNPVLWRPVDPHDCVYVDDPSSSAVADLAEVSYALMLWCLVHAYGVTNTDDTRLLVTTAMGLMQTVSALGRSLARMPASASLPGVTAGTTFGKPNSLTALVDGESAWHLLAFASARVADGADVVAAAPGAPSVGAKLRTLAGPLADRAARAT
jgi:ferritin-like protein